NKSTVSIANVVNDVVDILSQNIQEKNIKIQKHITDNSVVSADYDQLQIIFRNILANAIKFTPNEGIIAFSAIKNNDTWEVSVKDSGMGMSEAKVNELNSEALIKSDIGTNGERGTGFGWMIIKEFVAANKGTFKIESKIGEGTCITIVLPIASGS
ncbi:MAG: HAMP domain-containing histidine kinase, partial [Bacteroidia bacterium]|nr:HAMP domain-containing histidine kinase [Bacteroidia bacterium]